MTIFTIIHDKKFSLQQPLHFHSDLVMHARKLPRISEPSFDKDYSNSNSYDGGGAEEEEKAIHPSIHLPPKTN